MTPRFWRWFRRRRHPRLSSYAMADLDDAFRAAFQHGKCIGSLHSSRCLFRDSDWRD